MSIAKLYDKTITTSRLTAVGGGSNRSSWTANLSGIKCAIHPLSDEQTSFGGGFNQGYKMFCAQSLDIEIGDRVIDGTDIYKVVGKSSYDDGRVSSNRHARYTLNKGK